MEANKEDIIRIAETAIENITQLTNIVGRSSLPSGSSNNAELHWHFPTVDPRGRNTACGPPGYRRSASAPYCWRTPGEPTESPSVTKDVVVIEYGHDRVPSKAEKAKLEKSKRVVSRFVVSKDRSAKQLEKELATLLKGTKMEGFCFKIDSAFKL